MPILWLLLSLAGGPSPPEVSASLAQASMLREKLDEAGALAKYREALLEDSTNLEALWNASYLATILGARDSLHHSPLMDLGRHLAEKAIQQWPDQAESHFALAVNIGMGLKHQSVRQKLASSRVLREEIRRTLELNPRHGGAWFLLGRWQYAYATLGTFETMTAKLFLGGIPPEATLQNAETQFPHRPPMESGRTALPPGPGPHLGGGGTQGRGPQGPCLRTPPGPSVRGRSSELREDARPAEAHRGVTGRESRYRCFGFAGSNLVFG
jgi:hypothetical protein